MPGTQLAAAPAQPNTIAAIGSIGAPTSAKAAMVRSEPSSTSMARSTNGPAKGRSRAAPVAASTSGSVREIGAASHDSPPACTSTSDGASHTTTTTVSSVDCTTSSTLATTGIPWT